jgi:DNA-binding response OmpR family regulator
MTAIVTKDETESMGSNIGGNEFLAKPVKTDELLATIERVLGE